MDEGTENQTNSTSGGVGRVFSSLRRSSSNMVDGADGSLFWLIKWCANQVKIIAQAISQQLNSAQIGMERRAMERAAQDEEDKQ